MFKPDKIPIKRLHGLILLVLSATVLQALYWSTHHWISRPAPIPIDQQIRVWDVAEIPTPTLQATEGVTFSKGTVPVRIFPDQAPSYVAFRSSFTLDPLQSGDLGLGTAFDTDNAHIFLNGAVVHDPGRLTAPATYHARERVIIRLSRGLLRQGTNELMAITTTNAPGRGVGAHTAILGDYHALMDATAQRRFFFHEYRYFTMTTAGLIAFVLGILILQTRNKAAIAWLAILCLTIALRTAWTVYFGYLGGEAIRFLIIFSLAMCVPFALFMFILSWAGVRNKFIKRAVPAVFIAVLAIVTLLLFRDASAGYRPAEIVTNYLMTTMAFGSAITLSHHIWVTQHLRVAETACLILVVTLANIDSLSLLVNDVDTNHLRLVSPLILLGLVAAILARNLKLFESLGAFNDALGAELEKRSEIIEANYRKLAEAEKQRNLIDERARILRDMHDGIGGLLTGLLVQVRSGRLSDRETSMGLETALNDLRLVVESLDPEFASFEDALAAMRARFAKQLSAAGIELTWDFTDAQLILLSPSETLQIARILQECVTNTIRHSNADSVAIFGKPFAAGCHYSLNYRDNGTSIADNLEKRSGHGLQNMRSRAASLGSDITVSLSKETGFSLSMAIERSLV